MATLTPTFDTGALTLPGPMTTAVPERIVTQEMLDAADDRVAGLNAPLDRKSVV